MTHSCREEGRLAERALAHRECREARMPSGIRGAMGIARGRVRQARPSTADGLEESGGCFSTRVNSRSTFDA